MPYDCFISYASADSESAEILHRRLAAEGFTVWFDKIRLQPGFDWHKEIEQGCENSRILLPILTPRWKNSDWTKYETYGAEAVIPLVFEGQWDQVSTPPLERFQAERIDFSSAGEADWPRLFAAMKRVLEQPVPEKAARITHLHHRTNDYFIGRENDLLRIHEELHCNPRAVLTQGRVRAIAAMGGVGKTTLARHYAEKYWRCYPQMFWVDCRNGLEAEYANICDELFPQLLHAGLNPRDKAVRTLRELENSASRLLILDNAEDERSVQEWIPKTGGCHTLITSRYANWSASIQTFHLYVLDMEPALQFLARRSKRALNGSEQEACQILAEKLGYLPLALEQAAAYIEQQGENFGFSDYLRLYAESARDLLEVDALGSTFYPDSVITTWKPTVDKLTPCARTMLRILSFMSASHVPVKLYLNGASRIAKLIGAMEASVAPPGSPGEAWVRSGLAQLRAYSMVESDGQMMSMHPLLQTVEQLWLKPEEEKLVVQCAMDLFVAFAPIVIRRFEMVKQWLWLSAHAEELLAHAHRVGLSPAAPLLRGLSYVCYDRGQIKRALRLALESLAGRGGLDDIVDRSSLTCLQKIANMLNKLQHRGFAEALLRRATRVLASTFGERDRDTLSAMTDLANVLADRRKSEEARDIYKKTLAGLRETLGPSDPETLICLIGLGSVHHDLREYAEAEQILVQAVRGFETAKAGSEDPDLGGAHAWLGDTLWAQGKHGEAMPHYQRALDVRLKLLGANHPETQSSASSLIVAHIENGQILEIFDVMKRMVEEGLTSMPADWSGLLDLLEKNAGLALLARQMAPAEAIYQNVLAIREKTVGFAHPSTLRIVESLASIAQAKGDWMSAEQFRRRLVAALDGSVGKNHPDTLRAINELVKMLENKGDYDAAEAEYRKALAGAVEDYVILGNYAFLLQNIRNDIEGAQKLYRRALAADPMDAINHANYASLCLLGNELAEARTHLHEAFSLAKDKPDGFMARTLYLRAALAGLEGEDGRSFLGQFKMLLQSNIRPVPSRNISVRECLRQRLPPDRIALFDALYKVLNLDPDGIAMLNACPEWQKTMPILLAASWPAET